jgi:hypothetical protein
VLCHSAPCTPWAQEEVVGDGEWEPPPAWAPARRPVQLGLAPVPVPGLARAQQLEVRTRQLEARTRRWAQPRVSYCNRRMLEVLRR